MQNENKKIVIDKKLVFWLIPVRYLYRKLRMLISNKPRLVQLKVNGYELLIWANEDIGKSLMFARRHEMDEVHYFQNTIKDGAICLDVGANIGYFSMLFSQLSGARGKVYAFEPLKRNFLAIELAAEVNHFNNISVFQGVASNVEGFLSITIPEGDGAYARITNRGQDELTVAVPSISLDSFVIKNSISKIDAIKIDVEGAELLVLQGAERVLSDPALRPSVLMVELVSDMLKAHSATISMVLEYMYKFSYKPYIASKNGELIPYTDNDFDKTFNVFFKVPTGHP